MTSLLVMSLPKVLKKWRIDGSNCKWELGFCIQVKNCLNQSDDVPNFLMTSSVTSFDRKFERVFDQTKYCKLYFY